MEKYIDDKTYSRLVAALVAVEPNPVTGTITDSEIIWVLAEEGGIFPARVKTYAAGAHEFP